MLKPIEQLQDTFLEALRKQRTRVAVYLVSGIRLQGEIQGFDQFVVSVKGATLQVIYKRAISTIVPIIDAPRAADDSNPATSVSAPHAAPEAASPQGTLKIARRKTPPRQDLP